MVALTLLYAYPNGLLTKIHYTIYFGTDLLGPWWFFLSYPFVLLLTSLMHQLLLPRYFADPRISYLLRAAQILLAALICVGFFWGITLNVS